jgi:hypothetical protein
MRRHLSSIATTVRRFDYYDRRRRTSNLSLSTNLVDESCGGRPDGVPRSLPFLIQHSYGSNSNLLVKSYTLTYYDPTTGELIGSSTYGSGEKNGQEGDLLTCQGEVTTILEGLGLVRVVAEFEAFVSPRSGQ